MKNVVVFLIVLAVASLPLRASSEDTVPLRTGIDTISAYSQNKWYHQGNLVYYLEAFNDYVVYQGVHTGQFSEGDQLIFSVNGNSYRQNRYYIDGFRLDNRFQTGSTLYRPNLEQYNLSLDIHNSSLFFDCDTTQGDYVQVTGNWGGVGGINKLTQDIVHIFHGTGSEGVYKSNTITNRPHVSGAGSLDMAYTIPDRNGKKYRQHLYATYGHRQFLNCDQDGLLDDQPLYGSDYYTVQMDGALPTGNVRWLDHLGYFVNFSGKGNMGSEFFYNANEVADLKTYSASIYGKHGAFTTGLTWATNVVRHQDLQFSRNIIDQDGESQEPWYPDGNTHELSWAVAWQKPLLPWLKIKVDTYNSLIHFTPTTESFSNNVYCQQQSETTVQQLYRYEWQSSSFTGGILENTVGLHAAHNICRAVSVRGNLDFTLDGILLSGKSRVTPNFQAGISFDIHPWKWLQVGVSLSHERIAYNIEQLRFMSNDYLNGKVYYAGTNKLFATTGGRHHDYASGTWQPSQVTVDIPIHLRFKTKHGTHEIALLQSYKKYYNTWMTQYDADASAYGYYDTDGHFFLNGGEQNYLVGTMPTSLMGTGFFTNTPYYISQLSRYTFTGRKIIASISWQSTIGASAIGLGNGPAMNDYMGLSETTANPNTHLNSDNPKGKYAGVGRIDQDKGYILRSYIAYNICRYVQVGLMFKWTDGQPFSFFNTYANSDNTQLATIPGCSRGTNPTDGNFGCRESAIFQVDLHVRAQWRLWHHDMSFFLMCYNINDFGNVLVEYTYPQGVRGVNERGHSLALTVPRGFLATFKMRL